jgi:hypothetical protein
MRAGGFSGRSGHTDDTPARMNSFRRGLDGCYFDKLSTDFFILLCSINWDVYTVLRCCTRVKFIIIIRSAVLMWGGGFSGRSGHTDDTPARMNSFRRGLNGWYFGRLSTASQYKLGCIPLKHIYIQGKYGYRKVFYKIHLIRVIRVQDYLLHYFTGLLSTAYPHLQGCTIR